LVEPVRRYLAAHDLRTVVVTESAPGPLSLEALADGSYDGAVLTTTERHSALPRDLTERGIPHVLVNRVLNQPESSSYAVDNAGGSYAIADLLAELGHVRIASLQGPVATSTGRERAEGLRRGLAAHGIRIPRRLVRRIAFTHDDGYRAALELLQNPDRPSAIVCGNDVIALGALSAARHLGVLVPSQLTVAGFDDIALAGWPFVQLTTVRCDLDHLAQLAVERLVEQIADPSLPPIVSRLPVTLVRRGTHAVRPPRV
jgi:LacI family transcriptional regulator, galactose operon repressor